MSDELERILSEPLLTLRIPRLLRYHRKRLGLTLDEVAKAVGSTAQTVQRLETGGMTLSLDWLDRLMAALSLKPDDLVINEERREMFRLAEEQVREAVAQHIHTYADNVRKGLY